MLRKVKKLFLSGIFEGLTIMDDAPAVWAVGHEYTDYTGNKIRITEIISV